MIALRAVCAEDEEFLYEVYASTRTDEMALVDWSAPEKAAFLAMQFNAQRQHYLAFYPAARYHLILCDATAIGRLIVQRSADELLLIDIALLPAYRNAGIGAALIQTLQAEAQLTGKAVRLHVRSLDRARRLYQRLGFTLIGESGFYWEMEWRASGNAPHEATGSLAVSIKENH